MTYISRCEHGTPMALCQKCFPDVSEHNDWSNYKYTHPEKELTDEEIVSLYESSYLQSGLDEWEFDPVYFARAILRKAQEK